MILGSCSIYPYGKSTRNVFVFDQKRGILSIDYDSDYTLTLKVVGGGEKALKRAQKKISRFVGKLVTVRDLFKAGFECFDLYCDLQESGLGCEDTPDSLYGCTVGEHDYDDALDKKRHDTSVCLRCGYIRKR